MTSTTRSFGAGTWIRSIAWNSSKASRIHHAVRSHCLPFAVILWPFFFQRCVPSREVRFATSSLARMDSTLWVSLSDFSLQLLDIYIFPFS